MRLRRQLLLLVLISPFIISTALLADNKLSKEEIVAAKITDALVTRRGPKLNRGTIEGSLRVLTPEAFNVNGSARVTGDIFVPGSPKIVVTNNASYQGTITGSGDTQPADYNIRLNGSSTVRHIIICSNAITINEVPTVVQPQGSRDLFLVKGDQPGDFATIRNLRLTRRYNQLLAVPPGSYGDFVADSRSGFILGLDNQETAYNLQSLTLNSSAVLEIRGKVKLNIKYDLKLNSKSQMGNAASLANLAVNIEHGDATLNSSSKFYGLLNAPSGTLTLNADSLLVGSVICDRVALNSNSLLKHIPQ